MSCPMHVLTCCSNAPLHVPLPCLVSGLLKCYPSQREARFAVADFGVWRLLVLQRRLVAEFPRPEKDKATKLDALSYVRLGLYNSQAHRSRPAHALRVQMLHIANGFGTPRMHAAASCVPTASRLTFHASSSLGGGGQLPENSSSIPRSIHLQLI